MPLGHIYVAKAICAATGKPDKNNQTNQLQVLSKSSYARVISVKSNTFIYLILSSTNKTSFVGDAQNQPIRWVSMCFFSRLESANDFSHLTHLCGFSPEWVVTCLFRSWGVEKDLPQWPHSCGFSPVWVSMCVFRFPRNDLLHTVQLNGFSSVWVSTCDFRYPFLANDLSHMAHLYCLAPVWVSWWSLRFPQAVNALLHCPHLNGFSPVWILMCLFRTVVVPNDFPHWAHFCNFSLAWVGKFIARDVTWSEIFPEDSREVSFTSCHHLLSFFKVTNIFLNSCFCTDHFPFCNEVFWSKADCGLVMMMITMIVELGSDEEKKHCTKNKEPPPQKSVLSCHLNSIMRWCSPVSKRCKKAPSCYFAITRMVSGRRLCANNKGKQRRGFSKEHKLTNTFE